MSSFAWFQDGVGYGASDLANWQRVTGGAGAFTRVFSSPTQFTATPNLDNRSVAVGAGYVGVDGTWAWSSGETLSVPTASNDNPRKDLIVARLTTVAADGVNGLAIELVQGTPAATPQVPARPANAVALHVVSVPRASTTFTVESVRYSGQYTDQAVAGNGHFAIDWAGQRPLASAFPAGFALYDMGTNQRWVRRASGDWWTADPGPWVACSLMNAQAGDGTALTVTGELWIRESSLGWDLSGSVTLSPTKNVATSVTIASYPSSVSRPTQATSGATGQSYSATTNAGVGRISLMTDGTVQFAPGGVVSAAYISESFVKSPFNAAG